MATIDLTASANAAGTQIGGLSAQGLNRVFRLKNTVDFSVNNAAAADIVQMIAVPANTLVTGVQMRIKTAGTTSGTASIGDGSGASSWDAANALDATAGTVTYSIPGTDAYAISGYGKLYTVTDTIDLTIAAATMILGVVELYVDCKEMY